VLEQMEDEVAAQQTTEQKVKRLLSAWTARKVAEPPSRASALVQMR